MTWDEFTRKNEHHLSVYGTLAETDIKCPVCGQLLYRDMTTVVATNPPRFKFVCQNCDWKGWN